MRKDKKRNMSTYQELLAKNRKVKIGHYHMKVVEKTEAGWANGGELPLSMLPNDDMDVQFQPIGCTFIDCPTPVYPYRHWNSLVLSPNYRRAMCEKHYKEWKAKQ